MKYDHKSDESIRAYLLGLLPDDEATALEEEYFVDRQSFHHLQSEESALIVDYLDGRLHGRENEIFESRYLTVPELQRKVEKLSRQHRALRPPVQRFIWRRWSVAAAGLILLLGGGIWVRHILRKQSDSTSRSQPVKEKSISPVQPPQEPSVGHEHEPTPPSIMPVGPPNNKPFANGPQRKNRPVPMVQSREDHLAAGVQPFHQARPSDAATPTPVETARINSDPRNGTGSAPAVPVPRIKRVAVLDFDYGTVQSYVSSIYGSNQDVGKGITDMLVEKLVKDGKYSVIERKALDKILAEQNFSNSDRANPVTAAKIGQLLGVDAVIMGSVTKFGRDNKSLSVGPRAIGIHGVNRNELKAVCAISARLVDANSGEILAAFTGEGESKRSGASLIGGGGGVGGFDSHASNFGQTPLGEAVTQAVTDVGGQLGVSVGSVPMRKVEVSGVVADVSGNTLIINIGSKTGLKVGDKLEISRVVGRTGGIRQITKSPDKEALKTFSNKIGEGTVIGIDDDSAILKFIGAGSAMVGDIAKTPN